MATNVLRDCTFSVTPGGIDDGQFNAGSAVVFKVDTVTISQSNELADHSTAQDATPLNRVTKLDWEITCETKVSLTGSVGLEAVLKDNELVGFTAIQAGSQTLDIAATAGIVQNIEFNYAGPNTLRFTLKPYGQPLSLAFNA